LRTCSRRRALTARKTWMRSRLVLGVRRELVQQVRPVLLDERARIRPARPGSQRRSCPTPR
jgi:hypothetical protein